MWMTLQQKEPDDYVIATGEQFSIKQFVNFVAKNLELRLNGLVRAQEKKL